MIIYSLNDLMSGRAPDGTYKKSASKFLGDDAFTEVSFDDGYQVGMYEADADSEIFDGSYVGVWTDPRTNSVVVDCCAYIHYLDTATRLGRACNQYSIWDWKNNSEITL